MTDDPGLKACPWCLCVDTGDSCPVCGGPLVGVGYDPPPEDDDAAAMYA